MASMAELASASSSTMKRDFNKVLLTLDNVLIPDDKISETPSMQDGLDKSIETDLRILGCELIQTAGILLKLPQVAMATAQVVFQRFYYSKSFIKHNMEVVAMASIMLASKIEECPRRNRDVVNVFHHIKQVRNKRSNTHGNTSFKIEQPPLECPSWTKRYFSNFCFMENIHPLPLDQHYINLKNQVIKAERRVLKELGFCVHVKHPHKIIVMYMEVLDCIGKRQLVQCAWNFMNDSLRSDVFMRYHPESIACACIYLAARQCQVPLPNNPPWFWLFSVDEDEIQQICLSILRLYARPKPNYEALERNVEELKRKQQAAKSKARGILSDVDTPNSVSRQDSPKVISPNPTTLLAAMRKEKEKAEGDVAKRSDNSDRSSKSSHTNDQCNKRGNDHSDGSDRSKHSKSGSSPSRSSRSAHSESPVSKKRRRSPSIKKLRKQESFGRDKHKKRYRSRSLSPRSPIRPSKASKKSHRDDYKDSKDYYKEKDYYREKIYKERDYSRGEKDTKDRRGEYYREREHRSFSPEKDRHRSRKHRSNGHRDSPIRDKLRR